MKIAVILSMFAMISCVDGQPCPNVSNGELLVFSPTGEEVRVNRTGLLCQAEVYFDDQRIWVSQWDLEVKS